MKKSASERLASYGPRLVRAKEWVKHYYAATDMCEADRKRGIDFWLGTAESLERRIAEANQELEKQND